MNTPRSSSSSFPLWRRVASYLGGAFLGAVLWLAAWVKALDPLAFARQVELEGLDFLLPAMAVAIIALAIEVFLGGALLLGLRHRWVLWSSASLIAFFLFLTGRTYYAYLNGAPPPEEGCGCFGNLVERTPAEAFWQDAALMVPALLLAFLVPVAWRPLARWRWSLVTLATLAVIVLSWRAPALPLDNLATQLRPGVNPAEHCIGQQEDGSLVCLSGILPELAEGEHVVILGDLGDEALGESVTALNEYYWAGQGPTLWLLVSATEEELFGFRFGRGPAFEIREAPAGLLRPLYRTLPRSFLTRDGQVVKTYSGLPPLETLAGKTADGSAGGQ